MCGIAGVYKFSRTDPVDESLIKKMVVALKHRGPNDEGVFCKNRIGLGHARLSIIDLGGGHQPMLSADGRFCIVFNGEIYNFLELREELVKKGRTFRTRSDTEVLLRLYELEGEACLQKLDGMFAFAVWDEHKQTLFLARDRLGEKPLYYAFCDGQLIFASEIKAILQESSVKRAVDFEALDAFLTLGYVPAPQTMFEGIRKLPAAHFLVHSRDHCEIKEYWDVDFSKTFQGSEQGAQEKLLRELKRSVELRLISDVPLGAFLSGGVDSSSIVSLMSEIMPSPVITNSIGFSEKKIDELYYARIIAKQFSTDHHEYVVEAKALEVLDRLVWLYDEPFGDSSSIPSYYVSKMARQNVTVALSGDGGDELFAGYGRYRYVRDICQCRKLWPDFVKRGLKNLAYPWVRGKENPWKMKVKNKLDELSLDPFELYFRIISMFKEEEKEQLYSKSLGPNIDIGATQKSFRQIFDRCEREDFISKLQYLDLKTYLCDDILVKVDRASMVHGLEVRVPLLSHHFVEYAASLPVHLKMRGATGKYIFKKALSQKLKPETLYRKKMGFDVPMTEWLRGDLRAVVEKELFNKDGPLREYFNEDYVKKMWSFVLGPDLVGFKKTDFSHRIWYLFLFSRWFKKYISCE